MGSRSHNGALAALMVILVLVTLSLSALVVNLYYPGLLPFLPLPSIVVQPTQTLEANGQVVQTTPLTATAKALTPTPLDDAFSTSGYNALFVGERAEGAKQTTYTLVGGYKSGQWFEHTKLPIYINGTEVTAENQFDFNRESANPECSTELVKAGDRIALYSEKGKLTESAQVSTLQYSSIEPNREVRITMELPEPESPAQLLAFSSEAEGMPRKTTESAEGETRIFTADIDGDGEPDSVRYEITDGKYNVVVNISNNPLPFTLTKSLDASKTKLVRAWFFDIDGDGTLELIERMEGAKGRIYVYRFSNQEAKLVLRVELPE